MKLGNRFSSAGGGLDSVSCLPFCHNGDFFLGSALSCNYALVIGVFKVQLAWLIMFHASMKKRVLRNEILVASGALSLFLHFFYFLLKVHYRVHFGPPEPHPDVKHKLWTLCLYQKEHRVVLRALLSVGSISLQLGAVNLGCVDGLKFA